jgi:hypothetical protein
MKNAEKKRIHVFPGAGYLLGAAIAMIIGISLFVWLENVTISISSSVPIGTTIGILFEQRFHSEGRPLGEQGRPVLLGLLILGVLALIMVFILVTNVR